MKANCLGLFITSAKCLQISTGICVGLDNQRMVILRPSFRILSTTPIMPPLFFRERERESRGRAEGGEKENLKQTPCSVRNPVQDSIPQS